MRRGVCKVKTLSEAVSMRRVLHEGHAIEQDIHVKALIFKHHASALLGGYPAYGANHA